MTGVPLTVIDAVLVEDDLQIGFADLCRACQADPERLLALVDEGLLQPVGSGPGDWRFKSRALPRARAALRLSRDLQLAVDATALVLDLLDEIDALKARLRRAGVA